MAFREWVLEKITPCIAVISTPEAEKICKDGNGLTVVDLLRPFGYVQSVSVPVRTVGEQAYRIKQLNLRFFDISTLYSPPVEVANDHLRAVLSSTAQQTGEDVQLLSELSSGTLLQQTPWFGEFKQEFIRLLGFSELETFDHPVASLLVIHSEAEDYVEAFGELQRNADLPPLMKQGVMEINLLRHYLVLQDDQLSNPEDAKQHSAKFQVLIERFGSASCHMLSLNSKGRDSREGSGNDALFKAHMQRVVPGGGAGEPAAHPPRPSEGLGADLAASDLTNIVKMLEQFTVHSLLPHLEGRVRKLHLQVMASRKGVRNQLKNLLWRSKSTAAEQPAASGGGPAFGAQSVGGQLRTLADLAFMLQDYDLCLSSLRLLSTDLRGEKDWRHYAAAQEMQGLAAFMAGSSPGEVAGCFREAFARYDAAAAGSGKELRRYATRSQILLAEYCSQQGLFAEANAALMRAQNQEDNLIAAVLLEQAALSLLHLDPPSVRKWAFHLVLAALRFSNCQQPQLANRAYRQVLRVFKGREWAHIDGHLQDMLGKHAAETGAFGAAALHFAGALACKDAHPNRQRHLLSHFLDAIGKLSPSELQDLEAHLPLPVIDMGNINVVSDDAITFSNSQARSQPAALWKALTGTLLAGQASGANNWLEAGTKGSARSLAVAAGEEGGLDVDLCNPMLLDLHISQLQAVADAASADIFKAEEEHVILRGGEQTRVRLRFRGLQPGKVTVLGLRWTIAGVAKGYKALQRPSEKTSNGTNDGEDSGTDSPLVLDVVPAMPRLQVEMDGMEGPVYEGELVRVTARLQNAGSLPLRNLRLLIRQPELLCCPSAAHLTTGLTSLSDFAIPEDNRVELANSGSLTASGRLFAWPSDFAIEAGETVEWPFFLHPSQTGLLSLQAVWQYEVQPGIASMPWRMLRWSHSLDVLPLLRLAPSIWPSALNLQNFLLRLRASKPEGARTVSLQEMACSSGAWQLSLFEPAKGPGQREGGAGGTPLVTSESSLVLDLRKAHDSPGASWLAAGPVAHFHAERKRLLAAQAKAPDGDALDAAASDHRGPTDFAVGWTLPAGPGEPARVGVNHVLGCVFKESVLLRATLVTKSQFRWDFGRGPFQTELLLRVCNLRDVPASVCCEAGTSTALQITNEARSEARRWHMKLQADARPLGGSLKDAGTRPSSGVSDTQPQAPPTSVPLGELVSAGPKSGDRYTWTGKTRASVSHLLPGATAEMPLQVQIFAPGSIRLSDYALFWTFPDGSMNSVQPGPPVLLSVVQDC